MYNFKDTYQHSKNLNVLYVEDDKNLLDEISDILKDFFASVTTAIDGFDGFEKYNNYKDKNNYYFDLVITDINMPHKDGLSMIKDIMQINSRQMVIVVSAYNESERLIKLIQEGIDNFIMKPIVSEQLINVLYRTCKNINNQKIKDSYLLQQSKLVAISGMIDSISEEWLKPINILKIEESMFHIQNELGLLEKEMISEYITKHSLEISNIRTVLNEFRDFFSLEKNKIVVPIIKIFQSILILLETELEKSNIDVFVDIDEELKIDISAGDFKYIVLNTFADTIKSFKKLDIKDKKITIKAEKIDDVISLIIEDNAEKLPDDIILSLNNGNFNISDSSRINSMGLNLSNGIIQKSGATLIISNLDDGMNFTIKSSKFI